jgi:hypothetical protein
MKKALMLLIVVCGCLTVVYRLLPVQQQQLVLAKVHQLSGALPEPLPQAQAGDQPKQYTLKIPNVSVAAQQVATTQQPSVAENYINAREHTDYLVVASAYVQHLENVQVQGTGRVVKMLPDDNSGSKHQRFILRTPEDVTVLIAHNIDLAPRIANLQQGDTIEFFGEYVWNEKGGTVHWTHRDPRGKHVHGWLKHNGVTYQ